MEIPYACNTLMSYDFLVQVYPLCFTVLSAPPFFCWLSSILVSGAEQNIQFSKRRSIAIEHSPSIMFILILLQLCGLSYPRAVYCMKRKIHAMRPAVRHALMTLIDRVDDFINFSSIFTQKLGIRRVSALTSAKVRSVGGGGGKDQRSNYDLIGRLR